ncbi:MAG: hypothetical protein WBZ08_26775, partial [Pseudolabrys sp.]
MKSKALARSTLIKSGICPYIPNSAIEASRSRCAKCAKRQILRPDEEQQQAEDGLNVDRHQKQHVEIEGHCSGWSVCPDPYRGLR